MRKIVYKKLEKIDFATTTAKVTIVKSADQLTEGIETFLVDEVNFDSVINDTDKVYIPSTLLNVVNENLYVYYELEQYPFFKKIKEVIVNPKGVLRFRRTGIITENQRLIASDLVVFSAILGEPLTIQVKRTTPAVTPYHTIVTVNFGNGTMAHLEYTFSNDDEKIELEWSGIKQIIEFNSAEMNPFSLKNYTSLPLAYSVDSILATARKADQNVLNRLEEFTSLLSGGVTK
ncbi:hypothetical protein CWR48_00310 [Oceanobacillus arenosus]|uniref:Uncharacterized protein n=1 Tax=Oceanobacillus arenosus TaxID=1229153 RepID=A0A3D8Q169_9BACI|nr:hypothetical protein [Oceanobacillus arenosus]RDW22186.1 hypothetical protein CWR48_00310 [Oceanobacillus arenosus]